MEFIRDVAVMSLAIYFAGLLGMATLLLIAILLDVKEWRSMSTSYSYKNKKNEELEFKVYGIKDIGEDINDARKAMFEEYYKETEIGQSSGYRCFLLFEDISLIELYTRLEGKEIYDEYGRNYTREEIFEKIEMLSEYKSRAYLEPEYFYTREETFNGVTYKYDVIRSDEEWEKYIMKQK